MTTTQELQPEMRNRPSHAAIGQLLSSILPSKPNDVRFNYHVPRYDVDGYVAGEVILSVTPTTGVYKCMGYSETRDDDITGRSIPMVRTSSVTFLHRPWTLDRSRVKKGNLVLASHTTFDELLTTGWNTALAQRLDINLQDVLCVQGYKADLDRKIGLIGQTSLSIQELRQRIQREFGKIEHVEAGASEDVQIVAIMNAFNEDEVGRVLTMCLQRGWVPMMGEHIGKHLLYLTGQPRESGLAAAKESGMNVMCVGHQAAEEWGIRYMATRLREQFPGLHVREVLEPEEVVEKVKVKKNSSKDRPTKKKSTEESNQQKPLGTETTNAKLAKRTFEMVNSD